VSLTFFLKLSLFYLQLTTHATIYTGQLEYQDFLSFLSLDNRSISDVENRFRLFLQKKNNEGVRFAEQFQWFDKDETGFISEQNFRDGLSQMGFVLTRNDVRALMQKYDSNYDGQISYHEFLEAFAMGRDGQGMMRKGARSLRNGGGRMTQSLVDGVPTRRLRDDPDRWSSGLFYDWTHGLADAIHHAAEPAGDVTQLGTVGLPVAGEGSVGAWLENAASPVERRNFFELVFLLSTFEKRLGLQQNKRNAPNGGIEIQLGSELKCIMEFRVGNL
tara:strand:- start:320 stop:1141 length:822 start_codon:yes stop_codon:yes gene_type:complete